MACNDYIILDSCIYRILQKHFSQTTYYTQIMDLFHEVPSPIQSHLSGCASLFDVSCVDNLS